MTAYFDQWDHVLSTIKLGDHQGVVDHEERLVRDVTICVEMPGFPRELYKAAHAIILKHAVTQRPENDRTHPRVDTVEDHRRELILLSNELHTLFHEVGRVQPFGNRLFTDNPLAPLNYLVSCGEEYREMMMETFKQQVRDAETPEVKKE